MPLPDVPASPTLPARTVPPLRGREVRLRVVSSPDESRAGSTLTVGSDPLIVGREGTTPFADARLSRRHCRIALSGGAVTVEDLQSTNGSFVQGERLAAQTPLAANSVLRIGDTLLVLEESPAPGAYPAVAGAKAENAAEFVGQSYVASAIRRWLATAGPTPTSTLILGPSGSGKEVVARTLHRLSGRKGRFVALNCGAISPQLADSELFGHVKGAFTHAVGSHPGMFVEADGGTIFLDEVGDLPPDLQVKLLRTLQERTVRPVGSTTERPVDVRVVAATNADLKAKGFRDDLRARLATWQVNLPPLRERRSDILELARHFRERLGARCPAEPWTAELAEALLLHDWPLNARELEKLIERTSTIADESCWDIHLLPQPIQDRVLARLDAAAGGGGDVDREAFEDAVRQAHGNVSQVAAKLGCDRTQVYRWMRRFHIDPKAFRTDDAEHA